MPNTASNGHDTLVFYSAATFRRLLDSLARPGTLEQLRYPEFFSPPPVHADTAGNLYALGALLTVIDGEVTFAVGTNDGWLDQDSPVVQWLALRSGSRLAAAHRATFALFLNEGPGTLLSALNSGTPSVPEASATVIWCVAQLAAHPLQESDSPWLTLELRGPGIAETQSIHIAGLSVTDVESIQATRRHYPLGIDIFLIDMAGQCIGLPRTTTISLV